MWGKKAQLFKFYYIFHFLHPGIFNKTFETLLETSNFFPLPESPELFESTNHMCRTLQLLFGGEILVDF